MILVAFDGVVHVAPLRSNACRVVVVEAKALRCHGQAERNGQAVALCRVEHGLGALDAPGPNGVAAPRGEGRDADSCDPRALDQVGLPVAQQGVAAFNGDDLDTDGTVDDAAHEGQASQQGPSNHDVTRCPIAPRRPAVEVPVPWSVHVAQPGYRSPNR